MNLIARAKSTKAHCCKCGCELSTCGEYLADVFVMDKFGNFYCTNCEDKFEDGDERIFELEFEEE